MKKFDSNDLVLLKGNFSLISKGIPSYRKPGKCITVQYARDVLTGRVNNDTETTRMIFRKAKQVIKALKG